MKLAGAAYLLWLGFKARSSRSLISFAPAARQSLLRVFATGLFSNVLNTKPGLFVLAFIPQFVSAGRGSVSTHMLVYGAIFAVLTALIRHRRDPHRFRHFDTGAGPAALTRRMATACFAQGLRES